MQRTPGEFSISLRQCWIARCCRKQQCWFTCRTKKTHVLSGLRELTPEELSASSLHCLHRWGPASHFPPSSALTFTVCRAAEHEVTVVTPSGHLSHRNLSLDSLVFKLHSKAHSQLRAAAWATTCRAAMGSPGQLGWLRAGSWVSKGTKGSQDEESEVLPAVICDLSF